MNTKANKEVPTFKKMTIKAINASLKLLEENCQTNEDGFAIYKEGYNDKIIAELIANSACNSATENGVARVRKEMYGSLPRNYTGRSNTSNSELIRLQARIDEIERVVYNLAMVINSLQEKTISVPDAFKHHEKAA